MTVKEKEKLILTRAWLTPALWKRLRMAATQEGCLVGHVIKKLLDAHLPDYKKGKKNE